MSFETTAGLLSAMRLEADKAPSRPPRPSIVSLRSVGALQADSTDQNSDQKNSSENHAGDCNHVCDAGPCSSLDLEQVLDGIEAAKTSVGALNLDDVCVVEASGGSEFAASMLTAIAESSAVSSLQLSRCCGLVDAMLSASRVSLQQLFHVKSGATCHLRTLCLYDCALTERNVVDLAQALFDTQATESRLNLMELDLSRNPIGDGGGVGLLRHLIDYLEWLTSAGDAPDHFLQHLNLTSCDLGVQTALAIECLLSGQPVSAIGRMHISEDDDFFTTLPAKKSRNTPPAKRMSISHARTSVGLSNTTFSGMRFPSHGDSDEESTGSVDKDLLDLQSGVFPVESEETKREDSAGEQERPQSRPQRAVALYKCPLWSLTLAYNPGLGTTISGAALSRGLGEQGEACSLCPVHSATPQQIKKSQNKHNECACSGQLRVLDLRWCQLGPSATNKLIDVLRRHRNRQILSVNLYGGPVNRTELSSTEQYQSVSSLHPAVRGVQDHSSTTERMLPMHLRYSADVGTTARRREVQLQELLPLPLLDQASSEQALHQSDLNRYCTWNYKWQTAKSSTELTRHVESSKTASSGARSRHRMSSTRSSVRSPRKKQPQRKGNLRRRATMQPQRTLFSTSKLSKWENDASPLHSTPTPASQSPTSPKSPPKEQAQAQAAAHDTPAGARTQARVRTRTRRKTPRKTPRKQAQPLASPKSPEKAREKWSEAVRRRVLARETAAQRSRAQRKRSKAPRRATSEANHASLTHVLSNEALYSGLDSRLPAAKRRHSKRCPHYRQRQAAVNASPSPPSCATVHSPESPGPSPGPVSARSSPEQLRDDGRSAASFVSSRGYVIGTKGSDGPLPDNATLLFTPEMGGNVSAKNADKGSADAPTGAENDVKSPVDYHRPAEVAWDVPEVALSADKTDGPRVKLVNERNQVVASVDVVKQQHEELNEHENMLAEVQAELAASLAMEKSVGNQEERKVLRERLLQLRQVIMGYLSKEQQQQPVSTKDTTQKQQQSRDSTQQPQLSQRQLQQESEEQQQQLSQSPSLQRSQSAESISLLDPVQSDMPSHAGRSPTDDSLEVEDCLELSGDESGNADSEVNATVDRDANANVDDDVNVVDSKLNFTVDDVDKHADVITSPMNHSAKVLRESVREALARVSKPSSEDSPPRAEVSDEISEGQAEISQPQTEVSDEVSEGQAEISQPQTDISQPQTDISQPQAQLEHQPLDDKIPQLPRNSEEKRWADKFGRFWFYFYFYYQYNQGGDARARLEEMGVFSPGFSPENHHDSAVDDGKNNVSQQQYVDEDGVKGVVLELPSIGELGYTNVAGTDSETHRTHATNHNPGADVNVKEAWTSASADDPFSAHFTPVRQVDVTTTSIPSADEDALCQTPRGEVNLLSNYRQLTAPLSELLEQSVEPVQNPDVNASLAHIYHQTPAAVDTYCSPKTSSIHPSTTNTTYYDRTPGPNMGPKKTTRNALKLREDLYKAESQSLSRMKRLKHVRASQDKSPFGANFWILNVDEKAKKKRKRKGKGAKRKQRTSTRSVRARVRNASLEQVHPAKDANVNVTITPNLLWGLKIYDEGLNIREFVGSERKRSDGAVAAPVVASSEYSDCCSSCGEWSDGEVGVGTAPDNDHKHNNHNDVSKHDASALQSPYPSSSLRLLQKLEHEERQNAQQSLAAAEIEGKQGLDSVDEADASDLVLEDDDRRSVPIEVRVRYRGDSAADRASGDNASNSTASGENASNSTALGDNPSVVNENEQVNVDANGEANDGGPLVEHGGDLDDILEPHEVDSPLNEHGLLPNGLDPTLVMLFDRAMM